MCRTARNKKVMMTFLFSHLVAKWSVLRDIRSRTERKRDIVWGDEMARSRNSSVFDPAQYYSSFWCYLILCHFYCLTVFILLCLFVDVVLFCLFFLVTKSTKIIEIWEKISRNENEVERQKCSRKNCNDRSTVSITTENNTKTINFFIYLLIYSFMINIYFKTHC